MTPSPVTLERRSSAKLLILATIDRIEAVVLEETEALKRALPYDLNSSNNRKSQSIIDFNNAIRNLRPSDLDAELRDRLHRIRMRLAENLSVIRLNLDAVREISSVLSETVRNSESDGTYSRMNRTGRL